MNNPPDKIASEDKITSLLKDQKNIDKSLKPKAALFESNPDLYFKKWATYCSASKERAESFKYSLNYFQSLAEEEKFIEENHIQRGQHLGSGMIRLSTAKDALSRASQALQVSEAGGFAPHFNAELDKVKKQHKKYATKLKGLSTRDPIKYSESLNDLYGQVPDDLIEQLRSLPHRHVSASYLTLTARQYRDLNKTKPKRKKRAKRHVNAPRVPLSAFLKFTADVYKNREHSTWQELMIALQLATGRRKNELGYLSTLSRTRLREHLKIDIVAKKRPKARNSKVRGKDKEAKGAVYVALKVDLAIPVVFYTPVQTLELFEMLRPKILNDRFPENKKALTELKLKSDSRTFDLLVGEELRETFHRTFPIQAPDASNESTYFNVHNTCRSVYAQFAHIQLKDTPTYQRMSLIAFANKALGHNEEDYTTTTDYLAVVLLDDRKPTKTKLVHDLQTEYRPPNRTKKKAVSRVKAEPENEALSGKQLLLEVVKLAGKLKSHGLLAVHEYLRTNTAPVHKRALTLAGSTQNLSAYLELLASQGISLQLEPS